MSRPVLRTTARGKQGPRGPEGERGPQGLPATGAAEDDAAIAAFASTPGTETNAALNATIGTEVAAALSLPGSPIREAAAEVVIAGLSSTPTVAHLVQSASLGSAITSTTEIPLAAALFTSRLDQVAILSTTAVAASDANYWTIELIRRRDGDARTLAYRDTRATGGQAITALVPWTFDTAEWSDYAVAAAGDVFTICFTKYGSPDPLTLPAATFRVAPTDDPSPATPTPLGRDSFNRADSSTDIGAPDIGAWEVLDSSVWGISGNQAYAPVSSGSSRDVIVMDAGATEVMVQVKVVSGFEADHSCGLVVRAVDANNLYQVGYGNVVRVSGGVATVIASWGVSSFGNGDTLRAVARGDTIRVYMQRGSVGPFIFQREVTDATFKGTKHGLRNGSDPGRTNRFDDFLLEEA